MRVVAEICRGKRPTHSYFMHWPSASLPRSGMLNGLVRHPQQAKTAEDARLVTLRKELDQVNCGLDRLYQAVEQAAITIDETLRARTNKLKVRRTEILNEIAKLKDRQALAVKRVNAGTIHAFCTILRQRLIDPSSALVKRISVFWLTKFACRALNWLLLEATGAWQTPLASCDKTSWVKCPAS